MVGHSHMKVEMTYSNESWNLVMLKSVLPTDSIQDSKWLQIKLKQCQRKSLWYNDSPNKLHTNQWQNHIPIESESIASSCGILPLNSLLYKSSLAIEPVISQMESSAVLYHVHSSWSLSQSVLFSHPVPLVLLCWYRMLLACQFSKVLSLLYFSCLFKCLTCHIFILQILYISMEIVWLAPFQQKSDSCGHCVVIPLYVVKCSIALSLFYRLFISQQQQFHPHHSNRDWTIDLVRWVFYSYCCFFLVVNVACLQFVEVLSLLVLIVCIQMLNFIFLFYRWVVSLPQ